MSLSGTSSTEYRSNLSSLSKAITQALPAFSIKALEKNLINCDDCTVAQNSPPTSSTAATLLLTLLTRIEIKSSEFYKVLEILREIPVLVLAEKILHPPKPTNRDCIFLDEPPDALKCMICLEVASNPLQHEGCGRLYCEMCVKRYHEYNRKTLPCLQANGR